MAIYAAQCLEHELVNDFIYLDLIPREMPNSHSTAWEQAVDEFASRHFENTLGKMIVHLKKITDVVPDLSDKLSEALKVRNWLAHHFFRERAKEFLSSEGRMTMILELQKATALLREADESLARILDPVKEKYGITEESIDKISKEMLKEESNGKNV